ncbi:nuclear speckle splicing regulatory protein 1 [Galleria mellonella]|uniref:Nuclear speckle splicing regulatory protein 1 n=1 Tax=Galleria mellonella TaxID=7137 RepID=A0A6J1WTJ7_GALME|nr:nuclear speckle splicing regulatory protein 1 [Galleria mellonella]
MANNKQYGLILPEKVKKQPVFQATRNVFGDDSESDEENNKKPILLRPSYNINRQAKITQQNALMEDPTVYQYDEVYDSMSNQKEEKKAKVKEEKKPRYIENLIKSANKRKIENERRIERQIQKEREMEGDEFADKEVFVTSAYKKKLEELNLEEEREKREEYLESIGDVTKQKDLGGFYRHLYEQKLGSDKSLEDNTIENVEPTMENVNKKKITQDALQDKSTSDISELSRKRNYRKRRSSDNMIQLSEGEIDDSGDEINRINLNDIRMAKKSKQKEENIDADSDFSIDESSDEEKDRDEQKGPKKMLEDEVFKKPIPQKNDNRTEAKTMTKNSEESKLVKSDEPQENNQPKIDIWKKRTVGEVFDQALKRYYERKASRGF